MKQRSKRYRENLSLLGEESYSFSEAISLLKKMKPTKFDASVEVHFKINHKKLQDVRGMVQLPHGTGKKVKVLVFCEGEHVEQAQQAGADHVGGHELLSKVEKGWVDFDFVVSTPSMMKDVGKLGPILGRMGLMPKPKSGTVTTDITSIVKQLKSGRVEYKADQTGVVHFPCGKVSFSDDQLLSNIDFTYRSFLNSKPSDAKGEYIQSCHLASTMSPSIKIQHKG